MVAGYVSKQLEVKRIALLIFTLLAGPVLVSLDHVIVTHYNSDHIGGIDEVINGGFELANEVLTRHESDDRRIVELWF